MQLETIKSLVGQSITKEQLAFVDCYVHEWFAMFLPIGGNCGYAITPEHSHPAYMFVLPYDSESEVYIGDKKLQTKPDTIMAISPNILHHEVQNYLPPKYCAICIEKNAFETVLLEYSDVVEVFEAEVYEIKNTKLDMLVKEFILESQNTHKSKHNILEYLSKLITYEIVRVVCKEQNDDFHMPQNQRINEAVKFINAHYEKALSLEEIAKSAGLSKSHFTKLFTQTMKITPTAYLQHIRLQNSKKMLLSAQLSVTQVSRQCGFNSPAYFTKIFKTTYGETPKAFMKRVKK
ncbi:helix-turn-helix transcriptional regulator [Sulfurimonas sp.]|uniref:helix-turn-helix transcriptional regulator n=1 Tax=Sulfurimonas sp. TaxID=2022749 RepID=UPI003D103063